MDSRSKALFAAFAVLLVAACGAVFVARSARAPSAAQAVPASDRTFTVAADGAKFPDLPDSTMSPGDVRTTVTADVCTESTKSVRHVTEATKRAVYKEYGVPYSKSDPCEVDHLISLELGGSNDIKNLWPEHYFGERNARVKDKLENKLHDLVCAGQINLPDAQKAIATDWIAAYRVYVGPLQPTSPPAPLLQLA